MNRATGLPPTTLGLQKGVALISMLLVFSIIAVMTSEIALRLYLDIRRTNYFLDDSQARQYALGGEALARQLLAQDFEVDKENGNDHLQENWSQRAQPFDTEGGEIQLVIEDLNGRFNINNLVNTEGKIDPIQLKVFQQLLTNLELPSQLALNLADWLDRDSTPTGFNTEDQYYLGQSTAYRTANRPVTSTSELMAIAGYDSLIVDTLAPYIAALPPNNEGEQSSVNINTASAPVLNSLHLELNGERVVRARESLERGFTSREEFYSSELVAVPAELDENLIDVRSHYFQIWVMARYNERTVYLHSQVFRDGTSGELALLGRSLTPPASALTSHNPFLQTGKSHDT